MTEGIQATFTGTVTRTFGIGFAVEVPSGKYPQRVSVFSTHQPVVGATVAVTGTLTQSKDKEWTDKEGQTRPGGYSLKINDATVSEGPAQAPVQAPPAEWDQQQWGAVAGDSDTPF